MSLCVNVYTYNIMCIGYGSTYVTQHTCLALFLHVSICTVRICVCVSVLASVCLSDCVSFVSMYTHTRVFLSPVL